MANTGMDWTAVFEPVWTVSILPSNSTPWESVVEAVDADLVARDPVGLIAASRVVNEVPPQWLPWLAEERSVDEFSSAWPVERQKAVTEGALALHRVKGTRQALVRALEPLGFTLTLKEWFEPQVPFQRNTFRIAVDIEPDREWIGARQEIIRVANKAKSLHTKLAALEVSRRAGPATVYVGGVTRRVRTIRVGQLPKIAEIKGPSFVWIGAVQKRRRTLRVGPRTGA